MWLAAAALTLAGLVRGFSGFGAAMTFVPVASALYSPPQAVATMFLVDVAASAPLAIGVLRHAQWRAVLLIFAGAAAMVPLGAWLLLHADPTPLRWAISLFILAAVAAMASGWRYSGTPGPFGTFAIGNASGLMSGLASLGGPPVVLFWLGGGGAATVVRANIITYFFCNSLNSGLAFTSQGLFTAERLGFAAVLAPFYVVAILAGIRGFRFAGERFYRRLALSLCAASAAASLPLWSG